jgi:uncharacterized protein HemX
MKQLTWQAVGMIAVLAAVAVALATLAHWDSASIIAVLAILGGIGGGAAVAGGVSGRVEQLQAETSAQTTQLGTIERRVNGELDARITAGAERAASTVLDELRRQGVIR